MPTYWYYDDKGGLWVAPKKKGRPEAGQVGFSVENLQERLRVLLDHESEPRWVATDQPGHQGWEVPAEDSSLEKNGDRKAMSKR